MDETERKYVRMTTGPVTKLVCSFAVPSIVCMLMTSFYNMADTYFVSRINTQSVAAVGIVFSYMGIIQAVSFFFGHGSGNYISRALGARKTDDAQYMAATGLLTALLVTVSIAFLCLLLEHPLLKLFGATETIMPYASRYFHFILLGTPFISGSIVLNNQMRLQGNARLSMIGILSGGLLNVVLDPVFIFVMEMGVAGAGLATAVSQMLCFFFMLHLCGRNGGISINPAKFAPSVRNYKEIVAGGLPSLTRQGLMFLSVMCLNNLAARYGDSAVAAFSVVSRVMAIASSLMIGFNQGFQPVCGFNYGARKYGRVRASIRFTIVVGTVYCLAFAVAAFFCSDSVIRLFSGSDSSLLTNGSKALRYQCITFPLTCFIVATNMFLQNIRQTVPAVLAASSRQGLFFIPALIIGNLVAGISGLFVAQAVSDVCAFLLCIPLFLKAYRGFPAV